MDLCIECQANQSSTAAITGHNDECTVAWGKCNVRQPRLVPS